MSTGGWIGDFHDPLDGRNMFTVHYACSWLLHQAPVRRQRIGN